MRDAGVEYDLDASATLRVPGDWNTQRPELLLYEGTVWYEKTFDYDKPPRARLFVHFGAVSQRAVVYLNGERLGEHDGGFTPFDFEITDRVRPTGNLLVVKVDNVRRRDSVPTANTDWWNYGGITRSVSLVEVPETYVADYVVQLGKGSMSEIAGWVRLAGSQWHHWNEVVDALGLELPAGRHLVRVRMLARNTNLDYLEFRLR